MEGYVEPYLGQQYVGIDLHRRRSVIVRTTDAGEVLEAVQIVNTSLALAEVISRAGEHPEVVLESTYGWYWAVDTLRECEANVHPAHPLPSRIAAMSAGGMKLPRSRPTLSN